MLAYDQSTCDEVYFVQFHHTRLLAYKNISELEVISQLVNVQLVYIVLSCVVHLNISFISFTSLKSK